VKLAKVPAIHKFRRS